MVGRNSIPWSIGWFKILLVFSLPKAHSIWLCTNHSFVLNITSASLLKLSYSFNSPDSNGYTGSPIITCPTEKASSADNFVSTFGSLFFWKSLFIKLFANTLASWMLPDQEQSTWRIQPFSFLKFINLSSCSIAGFFPQDFSNRVCSPWCTCLEFK